MNSTFYKSGDGFRARRKGDSGAGRYMAEFEEMGKADKLFRIVSHTDTIADAKKLTLGVRAGYYLYVIKL